MQERELLKLLPNVLRARDFHLYLDGGKRITDLWLGGGKLLLGHKASGFVKDLKNTAERGLFCPLPHFTEKKFLKALSIIFPSYTFRLYNEASLLFNALINYFGKGSFLDFNALPLWRPFEDINRKKWNFVPKNELGFFVPVLPCPMGPYVLAIEKDSKIDEKFPKGEIIAPLLLAPACGSLYELIKFAEEKFPFYAKVEKALQVSKWQKKGLYLTLKDDVDKNSEYEALFVKFLEGGFLLPPSFNEPAILPGFMSQGEEAKLASLLISP